MERNDESLSTRDLAGIDTPARGADGEPAGNGEQPNAPGETTTDVGGQPSTPTGTGEASTATAKSGRLENGGGVGTEQRPREREEYSGPRPSDRDRGESDGAPLVAPELSARFQRSWEEVQTRFVDDPRGAVEDADGLVANVMKQLAEDFAREREGLEAQWGRGEDISTEDLRVALQRYRSFFRRLLST